MPTTVRVATYNVYLGADLSLLLGDHSAEALEENRQEVTRQLLTTAFPDRAAALARVIAGARLDLVGLQEVCVWQAEGQPWWDYAASLVEELKVLGEEFEVVVGQPTFEGTGEVALGEEPLTVFLQGSNTVLRRVRSTVQVESVSVGLFDSALTTPALGKMQVTITRGWCAAECTVAGDPATAFTFVNTHTEAYDEPARNRQRDELLEALPAGETPVVLVGDFNSVPGAVGMPPGFRDAWAAAGDTSTDLVGWTCCQGPDLLNEASLLHERIDYIWVRGLQVVAAERHGAGAEDRDERGLWPSDHACVVATLRV